jgi:Spy/CpxP family protein refolding chaperone
MLELGSERTGAVDMKRIIIWSSAALLAIVGFIAFAYADAARRSGWCGRGWHHYGPLGYVAHELHLNDAQKSQIKSMWQVERPAISLLVHEFAGESKEMDTATAQGNLDESRVEEIANRQGTTLAKLLAEKERFKSKIYTNVLTPEQRIKADELQKRWHERLDWIANRLENTSDEK